MPRSCSLKPFALLFVALAPLIAADSPGILPGVIGTWKQISTSALDVKGERPVWDELGLQDSQQGVYDNAGVPVRVRAWRLADSTGAMGAYDFIRPADAQPAPTFDDLTPLAARTQRGLVLAVGNYLVDFEGGVPAPNDAANLFRSMPRYEHGALPTFPGYLPLGEIPNSVRYIGGPAALKAFFPGVTPSVAAFHLGTEAVVANYPGGLRLALFSFPVPAMARQQAAAFQSIPAAVVKRSGPLLALILQPGDPNAAERLLSKVRYEATVTTGAAPKSRRDNPGNLLLNIIYLILILAGFCLVSGVLFGFLRMIVRRGGGSGDGEEILALHLEGRPEMR